MPLELNGFEQPPTPLKNIKWIPTTQIIYGIRQMKRRIPIFTATPKKNNTHYINC